jgi:hypothetical protein
VAAWSKAAPCDEICIASVVEAEPRAGVERLPDGRRKRVLGRDLDLYLGSTLGGCVFPRDRAAARFYAEFLAARHRAGRRAGRAHRGHGAGARNHVLRHARYGGRLRGLPGGRW